MHLCAVLNILMLQVGFGTALMPLVDLLHLCACRKYFEEQKLLLNDWHLIAFTRIVEELTRALVASIDTKHLNRQIKEE